MFAFMEMMCPNGATGIHYIVIMVKSYSGDAIVTTRHPKPEFKVSMVHHFDQEWALEYPCIL